MTEAQVTEAHGSGALTIGLVPGVSADTWVRVWRERMPDVPLKIAAVAEGEAAAALLGTADMVFARLPVEGIDADDLHVISLWEETPMVVAAKDHPIKVFDSVTLADLESEELSPGWDDATLDIVAAGHGVARMPQSVFRATGRRDVVARAISDAEPTRVGLVWRTATTGPLVDEFIGIVRGRTANSSRGAAAAGTDADSAKPDAAEKSGGGKGASKGKASGAGPRRRTPTPPGKRSGTRGRRR